MRAAPHRAPRAEIAPTVSGDLVVCHPPSGMHYLVPPGRLEAFKRKNPGAIWPCRHLPRRPPREVVR